MTNRTHVNHFEDYRPVDEDLAQKYDDGEGPGPESSSRFQLFFGRNWRSSRWNCSVISNMLPVLVVKITEKKMEGEVNELVIAAMLWDHIKQAQNSWQRRNPRIAETGDRVETPQEAQQRTSTYLSQRAVTVRRNSRKQVVSDEIHCVNVLTC